MTLFHFGDPRENPLAYAVQNDSTQESDRIEISRTVSEKVADERESLFRKPLLILIAVTSLFVALLFLVTALRRLHYPYELEELEGSMFLSALRVFHGQSVYVRPTMNYIPYMYPPGYYYAASALGKLMGMSMATLRMTSILSTLGCFVVIFLLVWTEVRRVVPALAGVGIYAGCYTVCAEWFDMGRLDSFFILLVLLAMYATRRRHPVIAAVLWVLAFQTKQSILPAAFLMLASLWPDRRRTFAGLGTLIVGAAGSVLWLNHITDGWYNFYVFEVPKANADIQARSAALFWPFDMFRPLALALIVIVAAAVFTRPSLSSRATRFYLSACSLIPLYWWIRTHSGSTSNSVMPIYALVAVLFGIALGRLLAWLPHPNTQLARSAVFVLLLGAFSLELAGLYNPGDFVPGIDKRQALSHVVAEVKTIPGAVYVAQHPYYAWLAGKPTEADLVSIHDALRVKRPEVHDPLEQDLRSAIEQHRYGALVLDGQASTETLDDLLARHEDWSAAYEIEKRLPGVSVTTLPNWMMSR